LILQGNKIKIEWLSEPIEFWYKIEYFCHKTALKGVLNSDFRPFSFELNKK